ncbi:MAG TPA: Zn-ribbon domain-containing OB-fold protein [Chloroflexota bacterium]|nr:Zn-ribbon domain-containing OB-fold protein [Chloroflexota bacterium]
MRRPPKPLPIVDHDTKAYWEGCLRGELLLQRCSACGAFRHPPSPMCSGCLSTEHEWVSAKGTGTVYSFVIVRRAFHPAWETDVPYVVAIVELDEGPHIMTNVTDIDPDQIEIGMAVQVWFDQASDAIALPKFRTRQGVTAC